MKVYLSIIFIATLMVIYRAIKVKIWKKRRSIPEELVTNNDYLLYLRNLKAYDFARSRIEEGKTVLDVGCWNGYGSAYLAKGNLRVLGIDKEVDKRDGGDSILESARKKYGNFCEFQNKSIEEFPDKSFDYVICFQVIEHILKDKDFLKEVRRVLKDGGEAFISTVNRNSRLLPEEKVWNTDHIKEYTATDFINTIQSVFPNSNFFGINGNERANKLEKERIRLIKSKNQIKQVIKVFIGFNKSKYDLDWFKVSNKEIESSWDFIAVCDNK